MRSKWYMLARWLKWFRNLFKNKAAIAAHDAQVRANAEMQATIEMQKFIMGQSRAERRRWGKQLKVKIPGTNVPIKSQKRHTFKKGLLDLVRK